MNRVSLRSQVALPPEPVVPALANELRALQNRAPALKLSVALSDLQVRLEGEILVQVLAKFAKVDERTFNVEISANVRKGLYPTFLGTLMLRPTREKSELVLEGRINIPLGLLGRSINATLFSGAARKSLQRFLDELARVLEERVRQDEERYARSVRFLRAP